MAKREHFFAFSWAYLAGLVCFVASAWLSEGPLFVVVVGAITVAATGVYSVIWRWLRQRRA